MALRTSAHRLGTGSFYLRNNTQSEVGFREIGQVTEGSISVSETEITLPDRRNPSGGNAAEQRQIETVSLSLSVRDFRPENIRDIMRGSLSSTSAASITDESITAAHDRLVPLAHIDVDASSVVVTSDPSGTTYDVDDDYIVDTDRGGIIVLSGGAITDGDPLLVSYEHGAYTTVESLVNSGDEFSLIFMGTNSAENTSARVDFHKVKFGLPEDIGMIDSDDFGALSVTLSVLADTSKGAGLSQYFNWRSQD